jgi:hypothetical protein
MKYVAVRYLKPQASGGSAALFKSSGSRVWQEPAGPREPEI